MMRNLPVSRVIEPVTELLVRISRVLPPAVETALEQAVARESHPRGRQLLELLLENLRVAQREDLPLCQDTGMVVVFAEQGEQLCLEGDLQAALNAACAQATAAGALRASMLSDPLRRDSNTGDNSPVILHLERCPGDRLTLHVAAKGGGSENMSALWMMSPSQGREGIVDAVAGQVAQAGGRPCPPLIVGVGIGGNFETCPRLAKRVLLRPLGEPSPQPHLAELERELLARVNATGVGPLGMGGDTTALAVHALSAPCHLATFPVAVNLQCHAARHDTVVI